MNKLILIIILLSSTICYPQIEKYIIDSNYNANLIEGDDKLDSWQSLFFNPFTTQKEIDTLYSEQGYFYRIDIIKRVILYEPIGLVDSVKTSNNGIEFYVHRYKMKPIYYTDTNIVIDRLKLIETINYIQSFENRINEINETKRNSQTY